MITNIVGMLDTFIYLKVHKNIVIKMDLKYELVGDCGHRYKADGREGSGIALCYYCKGQERYFHLSAVKSLCAYCLHYHEPQGRAGSSAEGC